MNDNNLSSNNKQSYNVIIEPDDTPNLIIPLIVLIIIVLFLGYMGYLLISSGFRNTSQGDRVRNDNRSNFNIICGAGQCSTNIQSGFKTCPINDQQSIAVDPSREVCNSRFVCDNPLTPYAVQSDGSTNINGVCEPNTECPCVNNFRCPNYILSVFTTSNGNPYQSLSGQRITFPQNSAYISSSGTPTDLPPIQFTNPSTTFCLAPPAWLPLSNPGCNFVSGTNNITYSDILYCMGGSNGCSGLNSNPCLQGTLAFITDNPDSLRQSNIATSQLGCARGNPCPCGQVAIFDTNFGNIICRQLPP